VIKFLFSRNLILFPGGFSHKRQPPPGLGYEILNCFASCICFFLCLPSIPSSIRGRLILNFISSSIIFNALVV